MRVLVALLILSVLCGCAVPTIYNPGGGGNYDWAGLSRGVGQQLNKPAK